MMNCFILSGIISALFEIIDFLADRLKINAMTHFESVPVFSLICRYCADLSTIQHLMDRFNVSGRYVMEGCLLGACKYVEKCSDDKSNKSTKPNKSNLDIVKYFVEEKNLNPHNFINHKQFKKTMRYNTKVAIYLLQRADPKWLNEKNFVFSRDGIENGNKLKEIVHGLDQFHKINILLVDVTNETRQIVNSMNPLTISHSNRLRYNSTMDPFSLQWDKFTEWGSENCIWFTASFSFLKTIN